MEVVQYSLFAVLAYISVLFLVRRRSANARIQQLGGYAPGAPSNLPLGLDLALEATQHMLADNFIEWTDKLLHNKGRTVELRMLGARIVLTDHSENIKAVMSTKFSNFVKGNNMHDAFNSVLGNSIFSTDGEQWLANKNTLRPHVAKIRESDRGKIEKHVQNLLRVISSAGSPIEIYDVIDRYQLDVVTDVFLGKPANSLTEQRQPFRKAIDHLFRLNTRRLLLAPLGLLVPDTWLARKSFRDYDAYLDTIVSQASTPSTDEVASKGNLEHTMMDSMVANGLSPKAIKDQLTAVLLAAKDPVAILLSWCLYELSRAPGVLQRLQREIETITGTGLPTQETIAEMPYLKNVINETIRLYHPVGINVREAQVDTFLPVGGGPDGNQPVGVPAGTTIAYSTIGLQRREDIVGADHDKFRPERWETWTPDTWEFIPFNHGPRICLGRRFGLFQLGYTLARLVQAFDKIEEVKIGPSPQKIRVELNTKMAHPIYCRLYSKA
ncbi:cytochrome P450 [Apiospora arundinis]|uniref:Cytochrome P450 n=1 Tax=Apiospora arundinis TaxID=335852 RepID=A0ABR2IUW7_9PEZI